MRPSAGRRMRLVALLMAAGTAWPGPGPQVSAWRDFLGKYLDTSAADGIHRVRYGAVTAADKAALETWLLSAQGEKVSTLGRDAQKAYWINLYNAATVAVVLRRYPVKSIRAIDLSGPERPGPWDAKLLRVKGRGLSLNDVENVILRPGWKDPRLHFALNCASLGCPNLASTVFTAANAEVLLEQGARDFINSPRGAAFVGNTLRLSSLFEWYRGDFGKTDREVLDFLGLYARPELRDRLRGHAGKIVYQYDWSLNGSP